MQERERRFAHNQNLLASHNPQHAPQHALQHAPQHAQYGAAGDPGRPGSSIPGAVGNAGNYADMDRRGHRQEDVMADDYQQLSEVCSSATGRIGIIPNNCVLTSFSLVVEGGDTPRYKTCQNLVIQA